MKREHVGEAKYLLDQFFELELLIKELNEINGGAAYGIPQNVFKFVDRELAAKGLLSLLIERSVELRKQLSDIGVDDA